MVITYHGGECFKIAFSDITIALNPISKNSTLKPARFGADIVIISLNDGDFNGVEQMIYGEKKPFVISGPGEYEVKKVFIKGYPSSSKYGGEGEERINTIYTIALEGINLCFLGALSSRALKADVKEQLGDVDILFVPIGGNGVLAGADAHALSVELEARIVIPMHYGELGVKGALDKFLKEDGADNGKPIDKLVVKKKDLEEKEGEIITLAS
jgi:L-ascorbate metabolism protein UlaG (beta-lactamase superfamily)